MKIITLVAFFLFVTIVGKTSAKTYTKSQFISELKRLKIPSKDHSTWACIAQHESSYNTKAINKKNSDGSWDWGLFQINDKWWCKAPGHSSHNGCKVTCQEVLDSIDKSMKCALQVKKEQGFTAWVAYNKFCK